MIEELVTLVFWGNVLRIAIPYVLAALCGAITERSGVIDLALEGKLLFGAFTGAAISHATGSPYAGVMGGMLAGMLVASAQMYFALRTGADQVIVGVAINLIGLAGTRFLLQLVYGEGSNSPTAPGFGDAVIHNPIFWIAVVATLVVSIALVRARWG